MTLNCARVALAILMTTAATQAATITTYSTQSAFSSAATGITMVDFASTTLGGYSTAAGLTVSGINIVGLDGAGYTLSVADSTVDPHFSWGTRVLKGGNATTLNSYIQINFASVTAVALHLASYWEGNPVQVTLSSGESFTVNTPSTGGLGLAAFWGFTSDTPETYVRISTIGQNGSPVLVDFQYGAAGSEPPPSETPEVMTMLTLGAGLVGLRWFKRFAPVSGPTAA